jgi:cobalt-zinc-cadmium efflux system outer membrane protein
MKKRIVNLALLAVLMCKAPAAATNEPESPSSPVESLTLEQALELAERQHPQLAEVHAWVEAAAGRAQQAGTLPNPELIVGAQQLPLDSDASNQREYIAGVAQPIPLGGRLGKAREAEWLEREVRLRGLEVARRDLRKQVQGAFATALYQERAFQTLSLVAESLRSLAATTAARVEAGDAVPEESARVEMELALARMEVESSQSMRQQALRSLASALGDPGLSIQSLSGTLETAFEIPTLESLAESLTDHPELALADATARALDARVDQARAERIPDIEVAALYHRLEATQENTIDLGLVIPLPLFDRNRGRIREARAEVTAAQARAQLKQNELTTELHRAHARLTTSLERSRALQIEILPRAEIVLKSAEARYKAGDASLAEILPMRRDWAAAQLTHLDSLRDVMEAWTDVSAYLKAP